MSSDFDQEMIQDFKVEVLENTERIEMECLTQEGNGRTSEGINSLFRSFHTIKGLAGFVDQFLIQGIAHQTEEMLDRYRATAASVDSTMIDLVLASTDLIKALCNDFQLAEDGAVQAKVDSLLLKIEAHQPQSQPEHTDTTGQRLIGELLIESQAISVEDMEFLLQKQLDSPSKPKLGELAVREHKAQARDVVDALRMQKKTKATEAGSDDNRYIRIPAHKVDGLVDMLGELMILGASVEQSAEAQLGSSNSVLHNLVKMSRITKSMQNMAISMRMISLKSTFQKLQRVARDASSQLGKTVSIEVTGEDIEIDRGVAERLLEPLLHLVKNCVSHGIEGPDERLAAYKSPHGQVAITASSSRGYVSIEVADDGRGMDTKKILARAQERNLVEPTRACSQDEIIDFLFLPGFSTTDVVDSVSGRGVGLDVVKTEVGRLGGKITVTTTPGQGSCFTLKIPINLAILNGTVVIIGSQRYILPTLYINKILHPEDDQWVYVHGDQALIRMRDTLVPLIDLDLRMNNEETQAGSRRLVVVLEYEQELRGLRVDSVVDRRDIVVKPMGEELRDAQCFSGASILGDGKVSLILDIEALYRKEGKHGRTQGR